MVDFDYMKIAETIPNDWYTAQEAKEISSSIFYDIMVSTAMRSNLVITNEDDMRRLLEILSKDRNVPVNEVVNDIMNISLTVGAVQMFNQKYQEISERFPKDEFGNPDYPDDFLARILGVEDPAIAHELKEGVLKDYSIYIQPPESDPNTQ